MVLWRKEPPTLIVVHGDFMVAGCRVAFESVDQLLNRHMEVHQAPCITSPEHSGETETGKYLKSFVTSSPEGFTCEADDKHAKVVAHPSTRAKVCRWRWTL